MYIEMENDIPPHPPPPNYFLKCIYRQVFKHNYHTHTEHVHTHPPPTTTTTTTITITTNASNRTLNLHHVFLAFQRRPQRRERRAGCNQRGGCTSRGNEAKEKSNQADKHTTAASETVQKRQSTTTADPQQEAHE